MLAGGRRLLNLCSNDYLGLAGGAGPARGLGSAGSRHMSGNDAAYEGLERALAARKRAGAALVYATGYMANIGVIAGLAGPGDAIYSDELNHASIIDACRLSGAAVSVYPHNDAAALEGAMRRGAGARRGFVVTEGVFSVDGDVADLRAISDAAERHGAALLLDDAHGDFVLGRDGAGTASHLGRARRVDAHIGSLSKALGSFGGYAALSADAARLLEGRSRALMYTSALPPAVLGDAARRLAMAREPRRRRLLESARAVREGLGRMGFRDGAGRPLGKGGTHIVPVLVGGEEKAVGFSAMLRDEGVLARAVRYPTVARGAARVRVSVTARLSARLVREALGAFRRAGRRAGLV